MTSAYLITAAITMLGACCLAADAPSTQPAEGTKLELYLLIGQSNMAGRAKADETSKIPHPRVFMFTKEMTWTPATDPIHFDKPGASVGPGLSFGKAMAEKHPDATIGLIPCAFGGSPLGRWEKGGDLYQTALTCCQAAMKTGKIAGILWHQGESDSLKVEWSESYEKRLTKMITDLRADLDAGDVPFIAAEILEVLYGNPTYPGAEKVNAALRKIPSDVASAACIPAHGLVDGGDHLHLDTGSQRELGRRYAEEMEKLQKGK
jgi:hypothetical protein